MFPHVLQSHISILHNIHNEMIRCDIGENMLTTLQWSWLQERIIYVKWNVMRSQTKQAISKSAVKIGYVEEITIKRRVLTFVVLVFFPSNVRGTFIACMPSFDRSLAIWILFYVMVPSLSSSSEHAEMLQWELFVHSVMQCWVKSCNASNWTELHFALSSYNQKATLGRGSCRHHLQDEVHLQATASCLLPFSCCTTCSGDSVFIRFLSSAPHFDARGV